MATQFSDDDRALLDRYFESVLIRFKDGRYTLIDATEELAQAFRRIAVGDPTCLDDVRGVVEAGDDA